MANQSQKDSIVKRAIQTASDPNSTPAQKQRARQIVKDIAKGAGAILIVILTLSPQVIAAERWTPSPDRGSAQSTLSTGRK